MAAPVQPTRSSIIAEGFAKVGILNPTTAQTTRADNEWMNEILASIHLASVKYGGKLKSLLKTAYGIANPYQNLYSLPTDFSSLFTVSLLDGSTTGLCQGGGVGYINLNATEAIDATTIQGKLLLMTSGTSMNSAAQVVAYNATTKRADIKPNMTVTPVGGDGYLVVSANYELVPKTTDRMDRLYQPTIVQRPTDCYFFPTDTTGEHFLYPTPDKTYGIQLRYYADLLQVDMASTLMTTLYKNWQAVFKAGIAVKAAIDKTDNRISLLEAAFSSALTNLLDKEVSGLEAGELSISPDRRMR